MTLLAVMRTSILESFREKILYGLVVFCIGLTLLAAVLSKLTLGHRIRVVTDLSLTGLLATGVLLAVILGATAISRDIERRVTLPVLAKPISRIEYFLGRFAGVLAVLALNFAVMAAAVGFVIAANLPPAGFPFGWKPLAVTILLIFLRLAIVASIAVTLSCFVSTTVAQLAALGISVAGHLTSELRFFLSKDQGPLGRVLAEAISRLVPDLGALDSLYNLIHGQPIMTSHLVLSATYAVCYAGAALALGCWVFSRRELS